MELIDYDRLMQANAALVFSERDPERRLAAIHTLYTSDAVVTEPEGTAKGEVAINNAVTELLSKLPSTFTFTPMGAADGHHGAGRLRWKAGPPNGPTAVTGMDIALFRDDRIQALYVFLDPVTAAEAPPSPVAAATPPALKKESSHE
jgi:hypothetical protein